MQNDIQAVFHNSAEFSDEKEIMYNGDIYTVPAVVSKFVPQEYSQLNGRRNGTGYGDGIYEISDIVYIPYESLGFLPGINNEIWISDKRYDIISAELLLEKEIVLKLRRYDE